METEREGLIEEAFGRGLREQLEPVELVGGLTDLLEKGAWGGRGGLLDMELLEDLVMVGHGAVEYLKLV